MTAMTIPSTLSQFQSRDSTFFMFIIHTPQTS